MLSVNILLSLMTLCVKTTLSTKSSPNIIFFLTDDVGFNDLGYLENTLIETPFIDNIVKTESLVISKYYASYLCTVSRASFLTGRYPMRYGLHGKPYDSDSANYALSKYETLLSAEMQARGFSTHLIGKWHLGFLKWDYTPTYRGFDTFLGYYNGDIDYWGKSHSGKIDWHRNEDGLDVDANEYSLEAYSNEISNLISTYAINDQDIASNTDDMDPFFMYIAWQGSHSPWEAPAADFEYYMNKSNTTEARCYHSAQTSLTDKYFGDMINLLKVSNLWDNTLVVFASDNGAGSDAGDNSPFRGFKSSLWEGGVRVPAFITGGYLPDHVKGTVFDSYPVHVTDWYPTLLSLTENENTDTDDKYVTRLELDGLNMWDILMSNPGDIDIDLDDEVYHEFNSRYMLLNVMSSNESDCEATLGICGAIIYGHKWKLLSQNEHSSDEEDNASEWGRSFSINSNNADSLLINSVDCGDVPDDVTGETYTCDSSVCLFDLENDPCEYYDVSGEEENKHLVTHLTNKLITFSEQQAPDLYSQIGTAEADGVMSSMDTSDYWIPWETNIDNWYELEFEKLLASYYNLGQDHVDEEEDSTRREHVVIHSEEESKIMGIGKNRNSVIIMAVIATVVLLLFFSIVFVFRTQVLNLITNLCTHDNINNSNNKLRNTTQMIGNGCNAVDIDETTALLIPL